ncbi:hypothetical protein CMI37_20200 [Candidatus Pacearchaeota archaeon]|nr:hypothetical protein [Candidatus Pacearchaeota archaeon]|tara:strand:+ start:6140 stop:6790 length:651 start_codon:yes stop_codon:yes gene_type:complete
MNNLEKGIATGAAILMTGCAHIPFVNRGNPKGMQQIVQNVQKKGERTEFTDFVIKKPGDEEGLIRSQRMDKDSPMYSTTAKWIGIMERPAFVSPVDGTRWQHEGQEVDLEYVTGGAYHPALETTFTRPNGEEIIIKEMDVVVDGKSITEIDGIPESVGQEETRIAQTGKNTYHVSISKESKPFMKLQKGKRDSIKNEYKQALRGYRAREQLSGRKH